MDTDSPLTAGGERRDNGVLSDNTSPSDRSTPTPTPIRNIPLAVLATLACIFTLRWASGVFIPLLTGILISYALSPVVDFLQQRRIPRALSAAVLILAIVGSGALSVYSLSDDASELIESLPVAVKKLRNSIRDQPGGKSNPLASVQKAASQLQETAEETARPEPVKRGVQRVQIEKPKFHIYDYLVNGTLGLMSLLGQTAIVALIAYFVMVSGDRFRAKIVRLAGPTLSKRKITLQALNEINHQIRRYMLVQLFTSLLVGIVTWFVFMLIGLENAAVWGIATGILNLIPYIGSVVVGAAAALVTFLQFGTLEMTLLVAGICFVIQVIEGFLLTPWMTSRANKMNPVVIFVGVLAWGWMWGVFGMLLGIPVMVAVKAVCDRVDDLKPIGELLGD